MNQSNSINRIVIMADNEVGVIADITSALAAEQINVESINTENCGKPGHGGSDRGQLRPGPCTC